MYSLSNVTDQYNFVARPPMLDRVAFTIDHIHAGKRNVASTYEVIKYLVDRKIPVTLFIQATDPSNNHAFDRNNARRIYQLSPSLVTLGVHPKSSGNTQQEQTRVHNIIRNIIKDVTGSFPSVLSYHGAGAGPEPGITYSGIKYARGILNAWAAGTDNPKNTPVMVMNTVSRAFAYTSQRNAAGYSSTIFTHTGQLTNGSAQKKIFDTYIKAVLSRKIQAVSYLDAMNTDFNSAVTPSPSPSPTPTPPANGTATLGSLRISASTKVGNRPVNASFLIEKLNGEDVASAQNVKTKAFRIPVGRYKVTAKVAGATQTTTINLTAAKGLHHIFLIAATGGSAPAPSPTPTPPPTGTITLGSLRLSASTATGRRPINANFLIEGIDNTTVEIANNLKTKAFRIPVGRYKVTAKIGNAVETVTINLTSSKGIHHIFLIPVSGTRPPTPTGPTPPANSDLLGSLRLSALTKTGRRPVAVDLFIDKSNGDALRSVRNVTTQLFRLPAGQYRATARLNGKVVIEDINLTATQGVHHIFMMPS